MGEGREWSVKEKRKNNLSLNIKNEYCKLVFFEMKITLIFKSFLSLLKSGNEFVFWHCKFTAKYTQIYGNTFILGWPFTSSKNPSWTPCISRYGRTQRTNKTRKRRSRWKQVDIKKKNRKRKINKNKKLLSAPNNPGDVCRAGGKQVYRFQLPRVQVTRKKGLGTWPRFSSGRGTVKVARVLRPRLFSR